MVGMEGVSMSLLRARNLLLEVSLFVLFSCHDFGGAYVACLHEGGLLSALVASGRCVKSLWWGFLQCDCVSGTPG